MTARSAARAVLLAAAFSSSCGGGPAAPSPATSQPAPTALRIVGLPEAVSPGATVQLRAEVTLSNNTVKECLPTWAVDNPTVASISATGMLQAVATGYVDVTATCDGTTARGEARVESTCPYTLIIVAQDGEVRNEFGVAATMEFLDGPRAGQRVATGSVYTNGLSLATWPVRVRFSADSYETREFVLAESTGERRNRQSPLFDFRVPMTFAPDAWTDTYVQTMSPSTSEYRYPIRLATAGDVSVRTWWSVDYNDRLYAELWCEGTMLRQVAQQFGSNGQGFTQRVDAPGTCEVRLRQLKWDAATHYRVSIRYPH